jgi:hypothetical protein
MTGNKRHKAKIRFIYYSERQLVYPKEYSIPDSKEANSHPSVDVKIVNTFCFPTSLF